MPVTIHSVDSPAEALSMVREDLEFVCSKSDKALDYGEIVTALLEREAMLWIVLDGDEYAGCYVTEIVESGRFVHIVAARVRPGHDDAFELSLAKLSAWARGFGARLSGTSCRPGMAKLLGRLGWEPRFVEYVEPEPTLEEE